MVRQYIGARYVPKFYENSTDPQSAEWESGVIYEPLTVVLYQNNSYISKKTVPANIGNPVSNPTYWTLTGLYNGQIAQLQSAISALEDAVEDIWFEDNRKYAIVTDSYGGTFGNTITPFTTRFAEYMGLTAGVDFCSAHLDGAGFVSDGRRFDTPINYLHDNMPTNMSPDDITDFIICGGCNDSTITSGIPARIESVVQLVKNLFPNAKVYIGVIGLLNNAGGRQNINKNVVTTYLDCAKFGAYPLQNLQFAMLNKNYFQSDNLHPNQNGMNAIGAALAAAMKKGYRAVHPQDAFVFTPNSAFNTGSLAWKVIPNNDTIDILNEGGTDFTYGSATTVAAGNVTLGTFTDNYVFGNVNEWWLARVNFYGTDKGVAILPVVISNGIALLVNDKSRNITGFSIDRFVFTSNSLLL